MRYSAGTTRGGGFLLGLAAVLAGCTTMQPGSRGAGVAPDAHYVGMGSSFAAGPGVTTSADQPPNRCARSADNYAHLLARRLALRLTDVSCSGAVTAHLLGAWNELPPQVDAITVHTRLVTVTIGGNDVGYIGSLGSASCRIFAAAPPGTPGGKCPEPPIVSPAAWQTVEDAMRRIVAEVRRRAPDARLVFVDYLSVLPEHGACAATPLPMGQADASRATSVRLAALTARVAAETGSEVLAASSLSRGHDGCSKDPWVTGFPRPGEASFVPYHPNAMGMAAIADALAERLRPAPNR